jgi:cellulose synthase/poly-beta-1,6-N-acetylglucosamine synthase-like glycosyltransferase
MIQLIATLYLAAAAALSLYGLLGLVTLYFYFRTRLLSPPITFHASRFTHHAPLPTVTVQLPIYNERFVVGRLITAAANLNYPPDRLQIQVLDDSTDDTTHIAAAHVRYYQKKGLNIQLLHRQQRQGYKAGALAAATPHATGRYLAIFDADFQPAPDFLQQTIPHFLTNDRLGMVQARWGHLNAADSPLTAAQAIALDKHFIMEQLVRSRARLFLRFNGSAGVWRRTCLEEAGGWLDDTVCEDVCLSTRATLKGWDFQFVENVVAPAELPATITAYKTQQARWAKGSLQCLFKYGRAIAGAADYSPFARLYALLSMSAYATHLLLLLLLLTQVILVYLNYPFPSWLILFGLLGLGQPLLFILSQQLLYPDWQHRLRHLPTLLLIAIGLAPSTGRALLQTLFNHHHPFLRTPKQGDKAQIPNPKSQSPTSNPHSLISNLQSPNPLIPASYSSTFDAIILLELLLALYSAVGLYLCLARANFGPFFFLLTCLLGFGYVAYLSLRESLTGRLNTPLPKKFRPDSQ